MDISSSGKLQPGQYSLRSVAMLVMGFFLIVTILTALVVVPKINHVLESQNADDLRVDLALEAKLFTKYVESQKTILEDLAQFPSLVNAAMLSDSSNPVLIDFVDNVVIGGEKGRLVLQDIGGTVLIKSVPNLQGFYGEGEPWVDQIIDGAVPYHFRLLGQRDDRFTFKLSVPVKYNNFIEGVLSAEITVSLEQLFVTQAFDNHIAFKLLQDQTIISTNSNHIEIAHEESVKLEQPNLTFVYITDTALINEKESTLRNTILLVLLSGFAISFFLFVVYGYRTESAVGKMDSEKVVFSRTYIIPIAVAGIGVATSITAFFILYYSQNGLIEREIVGHSKDYIESNQENINRNLDVLNSLASFYDASDSVERREFDTFAESFIANNRYIQAVAWIPKVSLNERLTFEEHAKSDGLDNFKFTELSANKKLRVAGNRDQYFPAYYIAPMEGHEEVIGFDMASQGTRLAALSKAGSTGTMVATAPVELVDGAKTQTGILVFYPVYSEGDAGLSTIDGEFGAIRGYVLLMLRVNDIFADSAVDDSSIVSSYVMDITDSNNPKELHGNSVSPDEMAFSKSIDVAGRTWRIDIAAKTTEDQMQWIPWLVVVSGLIVTVLITIGLVHLIRRREIVEALVMTRTAELRTLSSSVANSNDAFIITEADQIDPENGLRKITYVNTAFSLLTGYETNEVIGKTAGIIQGEKTDKERLAELRTRIEKGDNFRCELMIYPKNGEAFWVDVNAAPIEDKDGQIVQFVTVLRNITDRKQAEAEREELISQLTGSNEELQRFAYVCSHDLQEPLRMIRSFSEKLQAHMSTKPRKDEKSTKYLDFITDGAERAQNLIADILEYSSINNNTQKLQRIKSEAVVNSIKESMASSLDEYGGSITYDNLPEVQGNKTQLHQLFQNLINNALKYQKPQNNPHVHLSVADAEKYWQFSVADNGIGIAQRHQHKIFDVFQRLHRKSDYAGTGIGLSICKKIVERHGGTLWVESEPDCGSTFHFTLLKPIVTEIINERKAG